jgi:hypothetical protein
MTALEITGVAKAGGVLTKRIRLSDTGGVVSDASDCVMGRGEARRVNLVHLGAFANLIETLERHEAICLGTLRDGLPQRVTVATKARLEKLNGTAPPDLIARTSGNIHYRPEQPALALIDYDLKGMPSSVMLRIAGIGAYPAPHCAHRHDRPARIADHRETM